MSYINTFITVSDDCPVKKSERPLSKGNAKPLHVIQYELLTTHPYQYNHETLIYETYIRQKEIPPQVVATEGEKIKTALFSKGHPCLRASALVKRYGFGAHYNEEGNIAIYPLESKEYHSFVHDSSMKILRGMKSKK